MNESTATPGPGAYQHFSMFGMVWYLYSKTLWSTKNYIYINYFTKIYLLLYPFE